MRPDELLAIINKRPFEPVRLHISSGQHVDVTHPEAAIVTRSLVFVAVGEEGAVKDHVAHYNLLHIVKIEPLSPTVN